MDDDDELLRKAELQPNDCEGEGSCLFDVLDFFKSVVFSECGFLEDFEDFLFLLGDGANALAVFALFNDIFSDLFVLILSWDVIVVKNSVRNLNILLAPILAFSVVALCVEVLPTLHISTNWLGSNLNRVESFILRELLAGVEYGNFRKFMVDFFSSQLNLTFEHVFPVC